MRKPLTSIVMLAFSAATAFAQTPSVANLPNQAWKTAALQRLHDTLRNQSNLHDPYLEIAAIGNEESVPLLLERLRLDYGSLQHGDPFGVGVGFDCAQVHLVDALRTITNTDQGMYYPRWLSWWEANRGLSQQRWIQDGFAALTSADDRITCLAPDTLAVQWTRPIGANGTWGHDVAPIQYGSQVFVSTDNELTAFDASDGFLRWTASGGQESHGITVPTEYGLLVQSNTYKLELRDLQTGEVRRVWPQIPGVARVAVQRQFAAVVDFKGGLWLIDLRN